MSSDETTLDLWPYANVCRWRSYAEGAHTSDCDLIWGYDISKMTYCPKCGRPLMIVEGEENTK